MLRTRGGGSGGDSVTHVVLVKGGALDQATKDCTRGGREALGRGRQDKVWRGGAGRPAARSPARQSSVLTINKATYPLYMTT